MGGSILSNYIFDSHVHSINSFDGEESVDTLCSFSLKNNIDGICITDHCEINEYNEEVERCIRKSHLDVEAAQKKYEGRFIVRKGIELAQPLQNLKVAESVLEKFPSDFIIGSMNNPKDEQDFYYITKEEFMDKRRLDQLLTKYYEEYYEMTKWGKFDVIGHITYPLRYIEGVHGIKVEMSKYNEIIFEMLKVAAQNGIGIEVNVSGFRQPYKKQFPNFEHIKAYRNFGGEIVTIGTDSHTSSTLGSYFEKGEEILNQAGFKYYSSFKEHKPQMIKID